MNNEKKFIKLTPFKMQVLQSFPFIDEDFDAITNYELLCKVVDYLNKTVENVNELKAYIDDYFKDLDVQQEINNKLDSMAEDGSLTLLIKKYVDPIQNEFETDINNQIALINNKVNKALGNTPIPVSSTSEMTDTTKIYVNTSDGYWYYYNGTSWLQGGLYQSSVDTKQVNLNVNNIEKLSKSLDGIKPNLYNNTMSSTTYGGIDFTVNEDKSVTINGTSTNVAYISQNVTLPKGKYRITGSDGQLQTYHLMLVIGNETKYQYNNVPLEITLNEETQFTLYVRVANGQTITNKTVYPMITNADIIIDEYVPYGEIYLYENYSDLFKNVTGYDSVNKLLNTMYNRTYADITRTVNEDKSVTYNGTANAVWRDSISVTLPAGKYIATGVTNGSSNTKFLRIVLADNTYFDSNDTDINPIEFTLNEEQQILYSFQMMNGVVLDNYTIYPMIRNADVYNSTYTPYGKVQIYKPIQKLINYTKFNWSGKKLNALGDSIVYGANGNFINVIGGILNLDTVRNYGVGGSCIASKPSIDSQYTPAVLRYNTMSDDADIILVHAGTNDYTAQIPLGEENSTNIETFNGALNVLMTGLRDKYPDKLIIFSGILDRIQDNNPERYPIPCSIYRQAIEDRCYANHIVYYDGYKYSGFDFHKDYYDHILTNDGLHPNQKGADILGRKIAGFINWQ